MFERILRHAWTGFWCLIFYVWECLNLETSDHDIWISRWLFSSKKQKQKQKQKPSYLRYNIDLLHYVEFSFHFIIIIGVNSWKSLWLCETAASPVKWCRYISDYLEHDTGQCILSHFEKKQVWNPETAKQWGFEIHPQISLSEYNVAHIDAPAGESHISSYYAKISKCESISLCSKRTSKMKQSMKNYVLCPWYRRAICNIYGYLFAWDDRPYIWHVFFYFQSLNLIIRAF